jgi:cytoskeletal protein RodZ
MSDRLSKNKVYIIGILVVILIILGFIIGSTVKQKQEGKDKADLKQEKPYDGDGLEVEEDMDESVESIDGSGSWEEESKDNQKDKEKDTESNTKKEDKVDNSKDNSVDNKNPDNEDTDKSPELEEDTLEDDKTWGEIS